MPSSGTATVNTNGRHGFDVVAIALAILITLTPCAGFGQSAPPPAEFEVADVRVNDSGQQAIQARILPSGQISVRNIRMRELIVQAYKAGDAAGGPTWLDSDRFDIVAKAPPNTTEDALRLMLQNLLTRRFKLAIHWEKKIMPVYALMSGKRGFKLEPAAGAGQPRCSPGQGAEGLNHTVCTNFTMADLANWLSTRIAPSFISRPVVDLTGLKGTYDIRLDWVPQPLVGNAGDAADLPAGATVFEALDKQLGLKLESRKLPMPVIVIDHIERVPTEN
jgi:uncharacterized protein (TIGR03435 family)